MPFMKIDPIEESIELQEIFKDDPEAKEMFRQYELEHRKAVKLPMYQEKMQLRYHTPAEAQVIWDKAAKKSAEEIAKKLIESGMTKEFVAEHTGLPIKKVETLSKKYKKDK